MKYVLTLICLSIGALIYGQTTYSGSVAGEDSEPLPGVEITAVENPAIGTTTDFNGNFELDLKPELNNTDSQSSGSIPTY